MNRKIRLERMRGIGEREKERGCRERYDGGQTQLDGSSGGGE